MKTIPVTQHDPNIIHFHEGLIERMRKNEKIWVLEPLLDVLNKKLWEYIPRNIWSNDEFERVVKEIISELHLWRDRDPHIPENRTMETHGFGSMLIRFDSLLEDIKLNRKLGIN